ncbi:MAG TPA: DUF4129 domain-containing protein, partial [Chloroflexota bacterium]|nr:DUF4129 domain-containing protein [Chloroflexota bacterium]
LVVQWLLLALLAIGLVLWLARTVKKPPVAETVVDLADEHESVGTWSSLRADLAAWLEVLRGWLFGARAAVVQGDQALVVPIVQPAAVRTIRDLYRQLLALALSKGVGHGRHQTPYERLPDLQASLGSESDLAEITEAYVRARYGPDIPTEAEVSEARAHFERVRAAATERQLSDGHLAT